jgi:hypothetical protein
MYLNNLIDFNKVILIKFIYFFIKFYDLIIIMNSFISKYFNADFLIRFLIFLVIVMFFYVALFFMIMIMIIHF